MCFGNLFQQNNEQLERFEARMIELERRQQPATFGGSARRNVEDEYEGVMGDDFQDDEPDVFVNYEGNKRRNARRNEKKSLQ